MNDLPVTELPPNVAHLCHADDGNGIPSDVAELSASDFHFDIVPHVDTFHGHLNKSKAINDPTFGLSFDDDHAVKQAFVADVSKRSAAASLCSTCRASCNKLRSSPQEIESV